MKVNGVNNPVCKASLGATDFLTIIKKICFWLIYTNSFEVIEKNVKYPILKGIYFCILISFSVSLESNHGSGNSNLGKSSMHTHTYILLGLIFSICIEFIFLLIVFLQLILRSVCILFNIYHNGKKDAHPYSKWRVILLFLCLSQSTK